MFDSVNVNAPLPNGTRPLGGTQNIYQYSSGGISNGDTLSLNTNLNIIPKKLSMWTSAYVGHQESDASGGFASNSYNLGADAGRLAGYTPRGLFTGFSATPGWDTNLNMFLAWRGDSYFNITTGGDHPHQLWQRAGGGVYGVLSIEELSVRAAATGTGQRCAGGSGSQWKCAGQAGCEG
jgi:hypothetical protein